MGWMCVHSPFCWTEPKPQSILVLILSNFITRQNSIFNTFVIMHRCCIFILRSQLTLSHWNRAPTHQLCSSEEKQKWAVKMVASIWKLTSQHLVKDWKVSCFFHAFSWFILWHRKWLFYQKPNNLKQNLDWPP